MQSMTGFGSGEKGGVRVEIRSVNHRFMDISFKIPQNLSRHEIEMRSALKNRFSRGKFDVAVSTSATENPGVMINTDLAKHLHKTLSSLKQELSLPGEIGIREIAEFKEFIAFAAEPEPDAEHIFTAFKEAVEKLSLMRIKEGAEIAKDILLRLERLDKMQNEIADTCRGLAGTYREKFMKRLAALFKETAYDENRVIQEASIMAEKSDISEELTRIGLHIGQARKILSDGDTIGRKLEFILQELYREANTIASKAADYNVSNTVIEMKSEMEKIREQSQNIQ